MPLGLLHPRRTTVLVVLGPVHRAHRARPAAAGGGGHRIGNQALDHAHPRAPGCRVQSIKTIEGLVQHIRSGLQSQPYVVTAQVDEAQEVDRADRPAGAGLIHPSRDVGQQGVGVVPTTAVDARVQPIDVPVVPIIPVRTNGGGTRVALDRRALFR